MTPLSSLPALSCEASLAALLARMPRAAVQLVPLAAAEGRRSAGSSTSPAPLPRQTRARADGYACCALDLVGASVFAPVVLAAAPPWVNAGDPLPAGCDSVLPAALCELRGPMALVLGETFPGEGVWIGGEWLAAGDLLCGPGQKITALDLALAEEAGLTELACASLRLRLIDVSVGRAPGLSCRLLHQWLSAEGAAVQLLSSEGRSAAAILAALGAEPADLTLLVGGTGEGPDDHTAAALAAGAGLLSRGAGLSAAPGVILAEGAGGPVIALPGAPEAALTAALALLPPLLDQAFGRPAPLPLTLPVLSKVSSPVGLADVLLLARAAGGWRPLSSGPPAPSALRAAEAFAVIASGDEGYAPGAPLSAFLLQDRAFS